jgi:hypothetical protein
MSIQQSTPSLAPRFRIGLGRALIALGVVLAVAVTITLLVFTGANHSSVINPVGDTTPTAGSATTTVHYACVEAGRGHEVCLRLVETGTTPAPATVLPPG